MSDPFSKTAAETMVQDVSSVDIVLILALTDRKHKLERTNVPSHSEQNAVKRVAKR